MAYGQTGSGKSFTMTGDSNDYTIRGLIPRAIACIFKEIRERQDYNFTVKVSFLEIYNEQMTDLLSGTLTPSQNLVITEEKNREVKVKGNIKLR